MGTDQSFSIQGLGSALQALNPEPNTPIPGDIRALRRPIARRFSAARDGA